MNSEKTCYTGKGGLNWGGSGVTSVYVTAPLASIEVCAKSLSISVNVLGLFNREFFIPRESVGTIESYGGIVGRRLRIHHTQDGIPQFLVFRTFRGAELTRELRRAGYTVV